MPFPPSRKSALHPVTRALLGLSLGLSAALASGPSLAAVESKAGQYYEDALSRYNKNDLPGAVIQLKNALQVDKAMLSAQLLLGKALMASGEVAAAEVAYMEALRLGVSRSEVVIPLARVLIDQGKQRALFDRPELSPIGLPSAVQVQLLILRAGAQSDLGNSREAMRLVEEARAVNSAAADTWIAEVPLRIRARQLPEALVAADRALVIAPDSADAWSQKAAVLHAQGDAAGALKAYDKAISISDGFLEARIARAGLLIDLRRFDDAAVDVAFVRNLSPMEPVSAYLHAFLSERKNDTRAARDALSEVTRFIDPVPIDFIRYRPQLVLLNGLAHFSLGEMEKAKVYLEALGIHGAMPAAKALAQVYLSENSPAKAQMVLENYLRSFPKDSRALMLLASTHLSLGRHQRATALMQEALTINDSGEVRTTLGRSLLQGGQVGNALTQFEKAFQKDPGQPGAGFMLVGVYLREGQGAKAVSVAEAVVKRAPGIASYHNLLGMARGSTRDVAGARAAFEQALKLDPSIGAASLNLAKLEIEAKEFDKAEKRLNAMIAANRRNVDALIALSVIADRRGRYDEMQRALEKARDLEGPKQVMAAMRLVDHHLRHRQPAKALEAARRALSKLPEDFNVVMAYARTRLANNDAAGARGTLKDVGRIAEFDPERLLEVALSQLAAGDAVGAQYSLEKALAARPGYVPAQALLVEADLRQRDLAKAEQRARAILQANPKLGIGYSLLGDIATAKDQQTVAVEAYRKAYQTEPTTDTVMRLYHALARGGDNQGAVSLADKWLQGKSADDVVRRALGDAHARMGNFSPAKKAYEEFLRSQPNNAVVLNNLANVQLRLGDSQNAVKIAERAVSAAPDSAAAIDTLGWALYTLGQTEKSLPYLRDARLRDPGNPEIRYHLGAVLAKAGRKQEAREELASALQSPTASSWAADARKLLSNLD